MNTVTSNKKKDPESFKPGDIFKYYAGNREYYYLLCKKDSDWFLTSIEEGTTGKFDPDIKIAIRGTIFIGRNAKINITF